MKANITIIKTWATNSIIRMCVNNGYYTLGDESEYETMLCYVLNHKPTNNAILWVATDIVDHSDLSKYGQTYKENIESVMFALFADCVNVFFEIDD